VRADRSEKAGWRTLPLRVAGVYGILASTFAVSIAITRADWAYRIFYFLCPPAAVASAETNNLFSKQIDGWVYSSLTVQNLMQRKLLYDLTYTIPTILFGLLFYWIITWSALKAIRLMNRRGK
jgi:hypothetical protein